MRSEPEARAAAGVRGPAEVVVISRFGRPVPLALALAVCAFVPVLTAAVSVVQIPLGALPEDSQRLAAVPVTFFLHALAGVLFGVLGPVQFVRALRLRFGALHALAGRIFVLAGAGLALSGLGLLLQVQSTASGLLDVARATFGAALWVALLRGLLAARQRDLRAHRAWMIRAYALGMGTGTAALFLFPAYLIGGDAVLGLVADMVVVTAWLLNIGLAEWVVRRALPGHA